MNKESLTLSATFSADSVQLYQVWLSSKEHSKFTGSKASIQKKAGSKFSAWDGYIRGVILELEESKRICQTWRTDEFPADAQDSLVEITFKDTDKGCKLTLKQSNIPAGQADRYRQGWKDFYFKPMKEYLLNH